MIRIHRRSGNRFASMDLLYLTTTGARSGRAPPTTDQTPATGAVAARGVNGWRPPRRPSVADGRAWLACGC